MAEDPQRRLDPKRRHGLGQRDVADDGRRCRQRQVIAAVPIEQVFPGQCGELRTLDPQFDPHAGVDAPALHPTRLEPRQNVAAEQRRPEFLPERLDGARLRRVDPASRGSRSEECDLESLQPILESQAAERQSQRAGGLARRRAQDSDGVGPRFRLRHLELEVEVLHPVPLGECAIGYCHAASTHVSQQTPGRTVTGQRRASLLAPSGPEFQTPAVCGSRCRAARARPIAPARSSMSVSVAMAGIAPIPRGAM